MKWHAVLIGGAVLCASSAASAVALEQAQSMQKVTVNIAASDYSNVRIEIVNNSEQGMMITANPGTVLDNQDQAEQDLTISDSLAMYVPAHRTMAVALGAYCLDRNAHAPSSSSKFIVKGYDKISAMVIKGHYSRTANGDIQEVVWDKHEHTATPPRPDFVITHD